MQSIEDWIHSSPFGKKNAGPKRLDDVSNPKPLRISDTLTSGTVASSEATSKRVSNKVIILGTKNAVS